jgi:FtsZ-interacting cell division protein ZipA
VTTFIVIAVIVLVVLVVAFVVIQRKNREANIERADQLRTKAATEAQATIAPAQDRAVTAEAEAAEARAIAEKAEAEAEAARLEAQQVEASHEAQVRAADRLDPRVDHKADDYSPQVAGTVDQQPTPPAEVNAGPPAEPAATEQPAATETSTAPGLPRRTPGAQEMPGKPIETDGSGGWFTRKDGDQS